MASLREIADKQVVNRCRESGWESETILMELLRMRLKTGLWFLAVVSLFGLAGCGSSGNTATTNTPSSSPSLVSISISPSPATAIVGSPTTLTATGTYSDGSSKNISASVTWSSSSTGVATVSSNGLITPLSGGKSTITATSGSVSESDALGVTAVLVSVSLNPAGPAVVIGGTQQFQVIGSYNDSSTQDLTASASWSSSESAQATINSAGKATGVAAGPVEITAAVGGISATTALNVVSKVYANFSGSYAFTLTSADSRGPAYFAGTITADGNGNIAGVEDSNTGSGVLQNVPATGKYVIYPDGRGNIIFNPNSCHPLGISLRMILTSAGTTGSMIESDALGLAKGTLAQQNAAAFTLSAIQGAYVFRASGIGAGNSSTVSEPVGELGLFSASGAGVISSGLEDIDDYGTVIQHAPLLQSAYSVGSNGRGTLTLATAAGSANYVIYVVDSTRLNLLEIDPSPAVAVTGTALLQDNQTFTAANQSGSYAFLMDRPITVENGQAIANIEFGDFGEYTFDGVSAITGARNAIGITGGFAVTGGYVVGQYANGRGILNTSDCPTPTTCDDQRIYVFYVISASKMFVLQNDGNAMVGEADLQASSPYSVGSLTGSYVLHDFDPIASNTQSLLWLSMDGTGTIAGIADTMQGNSFASEVISNPYYIYDLNASGTGTIEMTTSAGTQDYRMYVVSPQTAWVHGVNPELDGSLDQQ